MSKRGIMFRIEHIDNITTGTCELCDSYGILTLEMLHGKNVYVCNTCRDAAEKESKLWYP